MVGAQDSFAEGCGFNFNWTPHWKILSVLTPSSEWAYTVKGSPSPYSLN